MANVPYSPISDIQPGQAPDNYQRLQSSPEAFGASMGRASQAVGQGIADIGKAALTIDHIYQTSVVNDGANKVQEKFRTLLHGDPNVTWPDGAPIPGYLATNGRSAMDGRKSIQDQMDAYIKEVGSGMDGRTKEQFMHTANQYRMSALTQVDRHAQQQSLTWAETVNNATAKNAQSDIAVNAFDDEKVNNFTHDLISARVKNLELAGLASDPQILRETIDTANRDALVTRLNAVAINDPIKAKQILDNNKDKAGPLYDEMEARLRVRVDQVTGEQAANSIIASTPQVSHETISQPQDVDQIGQRILVAEGTGPDASGPGGKPSSSAYNGFLKGTWDDIRNKNPSANLPPTAAEANREQLNTAATLYAQQNAKVLEANGLVADPTSLRLAHFLGPAGAVAILNADPDAPVSTVLSPEAIAANPKALGNKTVNEVVADAARVMGGGAGGSPIALRKADVLERIINDQSLSHGAKQYALATARTYFEVQNAQNIEQRRQQEEQRVAFTADLQLKVSRGLASYNDVEAAYQDGRISPATWKDLNIQIDRDQEQSEKIVQGIATVQAAFNGGRPLDPKSESDKKALDYHYEMTSQSWKGLSPQETLNQAISYSGKAGMVPTPFKQVIRGNLRSGSPDSVIVAANTVKQLRNQNPQILNDFSDDDLRIANLVGTYTDMGIKPAEAVQRAVDSMKVNESERKVRQGAYQLELGTDAKSREAKIKSFLEDKLDNSWLSDPTFDSLMLSEFNNIAQMEYEKTGNIDSSMQSAFDIVNRVWFETSVGGDKRYMKYAPEKVYAVNAMTPEQNAQWQNRQLSEDINRQLSMTANRMGQPAPAPIDVSRTLLVVDPTRTEQSGRPMYQVLIKNDDGVLQAINSQTGMPMLWAPDWESSMTRTEMQQREAENQIGYAEEIERLRRQRAFKIAHPSPYKGGR